MSILELAKSTPVRIMFYIWLGLMSALLSGFIGLFFFPALFFAPIAFVLGLVLSPMAYKQIIEKEELKQLMLKNLRSKAI